MRGKKAILNVLSSLVLQIVVLLSGFIVRKIIIQVYGSDINGLISSITQFLGYITLLESGVGPVIKSALYKPIANKNNEEISNILFSSEKFFKKIAKIFIVYLLGLAFIYPVIVANQAIDSDKLKAAISETGYEVLDIKEEPYEKKGFFSFLKK